MALGFGAVTVGVGGMNANFVPILVSKDIGAVMPHRSSARWVSRSPSGAWRSAS
jgi:hypothetical protein